MKTYTTGHILGNKKPQITYSIYKTKFDWRSQSMEYLSTFNMTFQCCRFLANNEFRNIIIDFGHLDNTPSKFTLIEPIQSDYKYYAVATTWRGETLPIFCNTVSELLHFINHNIRETIDKFQVVQIVQCSKIVR